MVELHLSQIIEDLSSFSRTISELASLCLAIIFLLPSSVHHVLSIVEKRQRTNHFYLKSMHSATPDLQRWIRLRDSFQCQPLPKWHDHKASVGAFTDHRRNNIPPSDFLSVGSSSLQSSSQICSVSNAIGSDPARLAEFLRTVFMDGKASAHLRNNRRKFTDTHSNRSSTEHSLTKWFSLCFYLAATTNASGRSAGRCLAYVYLEIRLEVFDIEAQRRLTALDNEA